MARDYKHRAHVKSGFLPTALRKPGFWRWMLATALIILAVVLLLYRQRPDPAAPVLPVSGGVSTTAEKPPVETPPAPERPHFDFYQILPRKETVVADHEIPTRSREERLGKARESRYFMQAGSFKTYPEADRQKARLGLLGIESKVLKSKIGSDVWYRVKIGPYNHIGSVNAIRNRLRQNGIDVLVTEAGE